MIRNTVHLITLEDLDKKLSSGRPLRVKFGIDPTAPDIHLGHSVVLKKLREFQDAGHKAVIIIGDFTAMIGDVSGHSKARPPLTREQITENAKTYLDQVGKVIDLSKAEITYNSSWLSSLDFTAIINLASKFTVAQMIERDEFNRRFDQGIPIGLHEFLYVLMQAYDSVVVKADVELGGTEQLFNLIAGRDLMRAFNLEPQVAMTLPILVGTDGKMRMSKTTGNHIGITEEPFEMFSKVMSISDALLENYYDLLTELRFDKDIHPMDSKKALAKSIVSTFHNSSLAEEAISKWEKIFTRREVPQDVELLRIDKSELANSTLWLVKLVVKTGIASSNSEAKRLIEQGGLEVNKVRITDSSSNLEIKNGDMVRIGKKRRFFRIEIV